MLRVVNGEVSHRQRWQCVLNAIVPYKICPLGHSGSLRFCSPSQSEVLPEGTWRHPEQRWEQPSHGQVVGLISYETESFADPLPARCRFCSLICLTALPETLVDRPRTGSL